VHAIGAGLVIFEIQQNSDTTFRVFDWNRLGLDGQPRELHVEASLASIDFMDFEPALAAGDVAGTHTQVRPLVRHALFDVDLHRWEPAQARTLDPRLRVIAGVEGRIAIAGGEVSLSLGPGEFCVVPASLAEPAVTAESRATFLLVEAGRLHARIGTDV
jgi:mannose-6-phosphate isomerase